jgi:bifunctional DNA-binding transcriptional regulator/antitoxin component of YhaV-PrlF toxin-antitoxin module
VNDTIVTSKGTTTIPLAIRRQLGIEAGTLLTWSVRDGVLEAKKKAGVLNAVQRHIRDRAGTWDGKLSASELLQKTRP